MIAVNDLLKLAIEGHGGLLRWEQVSRFRVAASITGAIWALTGQPGLLDGVVLEGEARAQRPGPAIGGRAVPGAARDPGAAR